LTIYNKKRHTYDSIYSATDFPVETLSEICNVISGGDYDDSHKWVETLMMFYNISLAKHLMATNRNGGLRAHVAPRHVGPEAMRASLQQTGQ
jgi:exoribonuclease R